MRKSSTNKKNLVYLLSLLYIELHFIKSERFEISMKCNPKCTHERINKRVVVTQP